MEVYAQNILMHSLKSLSANEIHKIIEEIKYLVEFDEVKQYLLLCIEIVTDMQKCPEKYSTLSSLCERIYSRQTKRDKVLKKEWIEAMDTYPRHISLVEKGETVLRIRNIKQLCSGFDGEYKKLFWKNQILSLYPDVANPSDPNQNVNRESLECQALTAMLDLLDENQKNIVAESLPDPGKTFFKNFLESVQLEEDVDCDQTFGLYEFIGKNARNRFTIDYLAEEVLHLTHNTWYNRRTRWKRCEEIGFQDGPPEHASRLKRSEILYLAVLFNLNIEDTIYFLGLAGYRLQAGREPDDEIISFFSGDEDRDTVMQYMENGVYNRLW